MKSMKEMIDICSKREKNKYLLNALNDPIKGFVESKLKLNLFLNGIILFAMETEYEENISNVSKLFLSKVSC